MPSVARRFGRQLSPSGVALIVLRLAIGLVEMAV